MTLREEFYEEVKKNHSKASELFETSNQKYIAWLENKITSSKTNEVIENFSGDNLLKLQNEFVRLYGSGEIAQEKANSFAVGFGKAAELICNELKK